MRILVLGSAGLLGSALCASRRSGTEITGVARAACDITDLAQVTAAVAAHQPDAVVNTGAVPDTRSCEADPARVWPVNAIGARNCAFAANAVGAFCVQISGNVVFRTAEHARREWEQPDNPHGHLAASKAAGEGYVRSLAHRPLVVRTACLFGDRADGMPGGLVGRIRQHATGSTLHMSSNTVTSAAYAPDVAAAVVDLLVCGQVGVFHLVNPGSTTPVDLARTVVAVTGQRATVEEVATEPEQRLLACDLAEVAGIRLRPLDHALLSYLTGSGR
ncbi:sugar nucleotide-binding protein [Streptacidiphilus sp. P02-A3a]|uniref:SDR family oxidoreductase n=1 Tax=Streptacidiphilus sp. P02-A3a TaxID=2704468 RepID=UPI0015FC5C5F|nr:sugar nucleotide-binding protein [Streptacidiphilus sp. P02-A3a]QMU72034.1 sugar nucleotide-binding protein [Streptacidiphilus sp. P02-A3a]